MGEGIETRFKCVAETAGHDFADFEWQGGYATFSVSQSNREHVKHYIATQEEYHRKMNFQDELRALLAQA